MELLLNLVWLLLAVPAYWAWRSSEDARPRRNFSALQVLLALGCALVLLFPVISATDDLHAMRAEIEESPSTKRTVRQAVNDKVSNWNLRPHTPPAAVDKIATLAPGLEFSLVALPLTSSPRIGLVISYTGRAPPVERLV